MRSETALCRPLRGFFCRRLLTAARWGTAMMVMCAVLPALLAGVSAAQSPLQTAINGSVASAPRADAAAPAESAEKLGQDWVRVRYDDQDQPLAMQSAIVRYAAPARSQQAAGQPVTVDLIGAVHIGDAAYYQQLNRRFEQYDALLYELVAAEGTVVPRGRGTSNAHPLGALQNGMKSMLALEHQLEQVDYTKKNFVHADMSPEKFLQAMKDRDEGFLQMYMRLLGQTLAQQSDMAAKGESPDLELVAALFAEDRPRRLKAVLAKQLAETESLLVSFGGDEGSVLITERNKIALKVLKERLAAGKKRIGIFYGAGHLADMDKRLRRDFSLQPIEITWLTAWDLAPKP